jgi:hypothetical protein
VVTSRSSITVERRLSNAHCNHQQERDRERVNIRVANKKHSESENEILDTSRFMG